MIPLKQLDVLKDQFAKALQEKIVNFIEHGSQMLIINFLYDRNKREKKPLMRSRN